MNSLFIETSAKTAVNVRDVFHEVVQKILDTPELWEGSLNSFSSSSTSGGNGGVPGGVQVVGLGLGDEQQRGCQC